MWRLSLVLTFCFCCGAAAEPLRLVANQWPPFTDARLLNNGVASDLVRTALSRAGYATVQSEVPWARALRGLKQGQYDVVVTAWYSEERAAFGYYSKPYMVNQLRFVQRRGAGVQFTRLADLYRYRIAVSRSYAYSPEFDNDPQLHKVVVVDFSAGARMVQAQRLDLAVEDEYVARYLFNGELADIRDELEFLPLPLSETNAYILVSRQHPQHRQIAEAFDQAIEAMRADGSYARIFQHHGF
jgi:polar amino acid transport system substrate-binding protein